MSYRRSRRGQALPPGSYRALVRQLRPDLLMKLPGPKSQQALFEDVQTGTPATRRAGAIK